MNLLYNTRCKINIINYLIDMLFIDICRFTKKKKKGREMLFIE